MVEPNHAFFLLIDQRHLNLPSTTCISSAGRYKAAPTFCVPARPQFLTATPISLFHSVFRGFIFIYFPPYLHSYHRNVGYGLLVAFEVTSPRPLALRKRRRLNLGFRGESLQAPLIKNSFHTPDSRSVALSFGKKEK